MKFKTPSILFLLTLTLAGCQNKSARIEDFDKILYAPEYASGFEIRGAQGKESVIIVTKDPWQGASGVETRLFIARGGEAPPEGFTGQVLRGEPRRIVAMSSTHIAMLDALGAVDRVAGVSGIEYVSNQSVRSRRDSIGDVGYEGNINYELLLKLDPDLVLLFSVNGASTMEGKLKEVGIPFMYVGDYLEESPLGKAEWLVAVSELLSKREEAVERFNETVLRYDALKETVAASGLTAPKVMINTPYMGSWFMPSTSNYLVRLIEDAGGDFIYKKNTGNSSAAIDTEEAYLLASQADIWLDQGEANSLDDVKKMLPKFADIPCFIKGNLYNNNRRSSAGGGNDYYESAVVNPDLVLRDLIKIFHPELIEENFVYYKRLE